jgi:hypothetical protein
MDLPNSIIERVLLESSPARSVTYVDGTHPVGIDLELLVRRDLLGIFSSYLESMGWTVEDDMSVKSTPYSQEEVFYVPIEISPIEPRSLSKLISELTRILSWLKHEDFVGYNKKDNDLTSSLHSSTFRDFMTPLLRRTSDLKRISKSLKRFDYELLKLPRGRSPMNLSAGCHLHFDVVSWFDSGDHIERFIRLFYQSSSQIKGQIIPGRYSQPGERANLYADFDRELGGRIDGLDSKVSDPKSRALYLLGREKMLALTAWQAKIRGDIEVRVFHSSLNISTITHWFDLIIDMIEKTKGSPAQWSDLDKKIKAETEKRSQAMARSQFQGPTPSGYSRSVSRILGRNVD